MRTLPLSAAPVAVQALSAPRRKVALYGRVAAALSFRYAAEVACEGSEPLFLCGDNRFDPYAIARYARSRGVRAEDALRRVLIARAFTGFQFDELIARLDPAKVAGPVIVSGICAAFLDEDMTHNDAARLFYRTLWRLREVAEAGLAMLWTESGAVARTRRAYFLADLTRAADFVFHLDAEHTFRIEMRSPRSLAFLARADRDLSR